MNRNQITPIEYVNSFGIKCKNKPRIRCKLSGVVGEGELEILTHIISKVNRYSYNGLLFDSLEKRRIELNLNSRELAGYIGIPLYILIDIERGRVVRREDLEAIIDKYPELENQVTEYATKPAARIDFGSLY